MKLVYFTNIWSHHHEGVCRTLHDELGDNFRTFLFQPLDHPWTIERRNMGWKVDPPDENWIIPPGKDEKQKRKNIETLLDADVAVGSMGPFVPGEFHRQWVQKEHKLWFAMGERFFKVPFSLKRLLTTHLSKRMYDTIKMLHYPNVHYLTMNHYCGDDLRFMHLCRNRIWTWGYFPHVNTDYFEHAYHDTLQILWCGRMLDWKRIDTVLKVAYNLKETGRKKFHVTLIGDGPCKEDLMKQVSDLSLQEETSFLPMQSPARIREIMRQSDVIAFSSNRMEGWGVTLLEAMSEGCAVVANTSAGATLDLIQDHINGWVYPDGDIERQTECFKEIYDMPDHGRKTGKAARETMLSEWNPQEAAKRLVKLTTCIFNKETPPEFKTGPCSAN